MKSVRRIRSTVAAGLLLAVPFSVNHGAAAASAAPTPARDDSTRAMRIPEAKPYLRFSPYPHPPYEARRANVWGEGQFELIFDAQGQVASVTTLGSAGNVALDAECLSTFHRWRVTPGKVTKLNVPVTFAMPPESRGVFSGPVYAFRKSSRGEYTAVAVTGGRPLLKSAPLPNLAEGETKRYVSGQGIFRVLFDQGGNAMKVETKKSTGNPALDARFITSLEQWQVSPGAADALVVPLGLGL